MKLTWYNGIVALAILCVSCNHDKKSIYTNADKSFVRIDTSLIEQWTHRELLCVDTTRLHPRELRDLNRYLER